MVPVFGCRHAPRVLAPEVERALAAAYGEPHRAYHDARHIAEVLRWYDVVADEVGWDDPVAVYHAILFHDVVYDATRGDNEARSAEVAARVGGAGERACELIRLTAKHGSLEAAGDRDTAHFLDADTAILGAEPAEFDAYDAAIRVEYKHVPEDLYRAGRGAFLAKMHARPRIFFSDLFHARLDARARENLARAIVRLRPPA
jgi:predicted metal-dependent HD superfamily phosphohydrolase